VTPGRLARLSEGVAGAGTVVSACGGLAWHVRLDSDAQSSGGARPLTASDVSISGGIYLVCMLVLAGLVPGLVVWHVYKPTWHTLPLLLSAAMAMTSGTAAGAFSLGILLIPATILARCTFAAACATTQQGRHGHHGL